MYVADNDGSCMPSPPTPGKFFGRDPAGQTTERIEAAPAVQVKSFSDSTFTPTHDLLVVPDAESCDNVYKPDLSGNRRQHRRNTMANNRESKRRRPMDIISSTPAVD